MLTIYASYVRTFFLAVQRDAAATIIVAALIYQTQLPQSRKIWTSGSGPTGASAISDCDKNNYKFSAKYSCKALFLRANIIY